MIKFVIRTPKGRVVLGIGLSTVNMEKLQQDMPIYFSKEDLKVRKLKIDDVLLFHGETEEAMIQKLIKHGLVNADDVKTKLQVVH